MKTPSVDELWLIRELVIEGYLSSEQAKQIIEQWMKLKESNQAIEIATLLEKSGLIKSEVLKDFLKNPFAIEGSITNNDNFQQKELELLKKNEEIISQIINVDSYKLLGVGNIGVSYICKLKNLDSKVIKLVNPLLIANEAYLISIKKGLEVIDYQNHPFLAPHQYNEAPKGEIYFTSQYLESESIGALVKRKGRFDVNSSLEIVKKVCDILKFFERIKRPHLGIHPENIFMNSDDSIYLKDFEWNRKFFTNVDDRIEYGPDLCFLSPEYINGNNIDHLSDIYSLGIVLYYILARRLPFHGNIETQLLKKERLDFVEVSNVHKNIPIHIGELIKKMIEPNRAKRYQNFEQLGQDIDEILKKRIQIEVSSRKQSPIQVNNTSAVSERKISTIEIANPVTKSKQTNETHNVKFILSLLLICIFIYLFGHYYVGLSNSVEHKTPISDKNSKVLVDRKKTKSDETPILPKMNEVDERKINQVDPSLIKNYSEIETLFANELNKKIDDKNDAKKFNKRINAVKVIQENLKENAKLSKDLINKVVAEELLKINNERQVYWNNNKDSLKKSFEDKNETKSLELIDAINKETENDEIIQNNMLHLRVDIQRLEPEESKVFALDSESQARKDLVAKNLLPLQTNHLYAEMIAVLSDAIKNEKNSDQKQLYTDQLEFFEHSEKIKNFAQNISVKPNTLLRSLYLDIDGELDAVSSKGFHVKNTENKIIPWNEISMKALAALVARYEPNSLSECISLLIFASRAGNHIAMKKAIRTIEVKYSASMNTPLVKESQEKIKELNDYLVEDAIKWQLGLIRTLKVRNNIKAKKDAEILINELRDEYLSSPIYKNFEAEIKELSAAIDLIK